MAIKHFGIDKIPQLFNRDGTLALSGRLDFFESGTVTPKNVFTTRQVDVSAGNSITLDAAGRVDVWMNGVYRIRFFDTQGVQQWELDDVNEDPTPGTSPLPGGTLNLQDNGSFEFDQNADGVADGWIRTTFAGGTLILDATQSSHGAQSAKMTSIGTGGGTYVSEAFLAINFLRSVEFQFSIKSSVVDVRNIVRLLWFQGDQSPSAIAVSATVYDDALTNPLTFTLQQSSTMPPADARFLKIELVGCDSSDVTVGNTNFDDVNIFQEVPGSVGPTAGFSAVGYLQDPTVTRDTADTITVGPFSVSPLLADTPVATTAVDTVRQLTNLFERAIQPSGIAEDKGAFGAARLFQATDLTFSTGPDRITAGAGTPFSTVVAGDKVIFDGSALNDGTFDVTAVGGGGSSIDVGQTITVEAAGATIDVYLIAQDSTLHVFAVTEDGTGNVGLATDDNIAGTNIGSQQSTGWTLVRRLWSFTLDPSADLQDGIKNGNWWFYDSPALVANLPTTPTLRVMNVPLGLNLLHLARMGQNVNTVNVAMLQSSGDLTGETAIHSTPIRSDASAKNQFSGTDTAASGQSLAVTDTLGRCFFDAETGPGANAIRTMGYEDERKQ